MKDKFKLSEENKRDMIDKIKEFFLEEYNEDLGELASQLVLDFFLDNLAPNIYNQAIEDSYLYKRPYRGPIVLKKSKILIEIRIY